METPRLDLPDVSAIRHGSKVGRFVVVAELGSGGMGVVYAAHDRELDRQVALKVMRGGAADDVDAAEDKVRMLREGQAMARVTHPNVITVFEVGTADGGMVFLAQELLDGGTLGQWLEKPHAEHEILEKFIAAGRGLAAAHAAGLVHRDFKPDNVLLGKDGRVRVSDFGLARAVGSFADPAMMATAPGGGPPMDTAVTKSPLANHLTRTGAVMGTPMFMAPEQHEGRRADERSDQFAFCVALYHALHGDWPYEGKTSIALADNVINGVMKPPPRTAKVSPRVRKILLRGLSTNADARYPSMEALLADLAVPAPSSGKKLVFAFAALAIVGGGGAAAYVTLKKEPEKPVVVTEPAKPIVAKEDFDPGLLASAIDQGTLKVTEKVFASDGAGVAQASAAFVMALRGDLKAAEARLAAVKDTDPKTQAYVDMAASAIAHAKGELRTASERAERCANALGNVEPIAAAMCLQTQGDAAADMDNTDGAKRAYDGGYVIAQKLKRSDLTSMFSLAKEQLDFDVQQENYVIDPVAALQKDARKRGAVSCEANAAVLASRVRLAKADQQGALDVFDGINPDSIQVFRTQLIARIARGEVLGYLDQGGDNDITGMKQLDEVVDEAKNHGFWGLVLEAQLAAVRVMLTHDQEGAEIARAALIKDATARGYKRIARLAQSYIQKPAESPPPTTPPAPTTPQ